MCALENGHLVEEGRRGGSREMCHRWGGASQRSRNRTEESGGKKSKEKAEVRRQHARRLCWLGNETLSKTRGGGAAVHVSPVSLILHRVYPRWTFSSTIWAQRMTRQQQTKSALWPRHISGVAKVPCFCCWCLYGESSSERKRRKKSKSKSSGSASVRGPARLHQCHTTVHSTQHL